MPGRWLSGLVLVLLLTPLSVACDGDADTGPGRGTATRTVATEEEETATPAAPTATSTPEATLPATEPASPPSIRDVDVSRLPEVRRLLGETFGELAPGSVLYADLTGDGSEEAIIPIASGGTAGNVAHVVYGYRDGQLAALLSREGLSNVVLEVEGGELVERQAEYGPNDPNCCPSQFRIRRYRWDGAMFDVASEETVPASAGP